VAAPGSGPSALPSDVIGTWEGRTMLMDRDSVTSRFRAELPADTSAWTLTFLGDSAGAPIPGHIVAVGGDSVVVRFGPYDAVRSAPRGTKIFTHSVLRPSNGRLLGTYELRRVSAPDSTFSRGRVEASRVR
jgi:hypothetical protein